MQISRTLAAWSLGVAVGLIHAHRVSATPPPQTKLTAADADAGDLFGWSAAISADAAVVGAVFDEDAGAEAGSAYVFECDAGGPDNWGQVAKLIASDAEEGDRFGYFADIDGDVAIVGAYWDDDAGIDSGSAYIFERNLGGPSNWGQAAKIMANNAQPGQEFGRSVSVSGMHAIVNPRYVFRRSAGWPNSSWGQVIELTSVTGGGVGGAVSISGERALVRGSTANGDTVAKVFERNAGGPDNWGEVAVLTPTDGASGAAFGFSLDLDGDVAIVGAYFDDVLGSMSGSAYVFERNAGGPNNWGQVAKLLGSAGAANDNFGVAVSVHGSLAIVGAYRHGAAGGNAGAAYLFDGTAGWGQVAKLIAFDAAPVEQFGYPVSIHGDHAIVGARFDDDAGFSAGSAYVLDFTDIPQGIAGGVAAFSDQTLAAGIDAVQTPVGMHPFQATGAVGDFDNDGFQDIYFGGGGGTPDKLYINNQDGTFTDRAPEWGIAVTQTSSGAAVGDYNNDGRLDIFVTVPFPMAGLHRLYQNQATDEFIDVAAAAGVNFASPSSVDGWGGAWGDYDLDGDLDLAVAGWASFSDGNRLFRNDGDGTFTDVTTAAGLASLTPVNGFAPRFADMDGDLFPELIWIGDFSTSKYYVNNGDGTFTDDTFGSGTNLDNTEMGATVADFDGDGRFDFYVTTIISNNLYINQGNNNFENVAPQAGVEDAGWGWATVAIDFDHDTRIDIIATDQGGRQWAFRNSTADCEPLTFTSVADIIGLVSPVSGRGLANFDYDNDGDQDIVIFPFNGPVKLFRNDLSGANAHWLRVFLDGSTAPGVAPNGIGSVVTVSTGTKTLLGRIDGGSNYLSQSEMSAHFGLGSLTVVPQLSIQWTNGEVTVLADVPADQTMTIAAPSVSDHLGDMNCDGVVDNSDVEPFVLAIIDPTAFVQAVSCNIKRADMNLDNERDGADIRPFVNKLLQP